LMKTNLPQLEVLPHQNTLFLVKRLVVADPTGGLVVQPCISTRWWTPKAARCSSKYGTRAPRHHARRLADLLFIYFSE
jgi:hypothetical protein